MTAGPFAAATQGGPPTTAEHATRQGEAATGSDPGTAAINTAAPLSGRMTSNHSGKKPGTFRRLYARPFFMGAKAVGLGSARGQELSAKAGLPPARAAAETNDDNLVRKANELVQRVAKIFDTTLEQLPDTNRRPQRSRAMTIVTTLPLLRGFKPKTVRELINEDPCYAADTAGARAAVPAADDMLAVSRGVLANLDARLETLRAAQAAYARMQQALGESAGRYNQLFDELVMAVAGGIHARANHGDDGGAQEAALEAVGRARQALAALFNEINERAGNANSEHGAAAVFELAQLLAHARRHIAGIDAPQEASQEALQITVNVIDSVTVPANAPSQSPAEEELLRAMQELQSVAAMESMVDASACLLTADLVRQKTHFLEKEIDLCESRLARNAQEPSELQQAREAASASLKETSRAIKQKAGDWQARVRQMESLDTDSHGRAISALVEAPPGFSAHALASPAGESLREQLRQIANELPLDDRQAERALPRLAAMEMLVRSVCGATGGDAQRAADLLTALTSHPVEYWIPLTAHAENSAFDGEAPKHVEPSADLRTLFHRMSGVPRGMEVLDLVSSCKTRRPLERMQMEAFHAYWVADQAQTNASDGDRDWLQKAKEVAQHEVRNRNGQALFPDRYQAACEGLRLAEANADVQDGADRVVAARQMVERELSKLVAYRAVTRGLLSIEPSSTFAQMNRFLGKVGDEWLRQSQDNRHAALRWLPRSPLDPGSSNPPFHPRLLKMANRQMEGQGIRSVRSAAHDAIAGMARELSAAFARIATTAVATAEPESEAADIADHNRLFTITAKVLCDYIAAHGSSGVAVEGMSPATRTTNFHRSGKLYNGQLRWLDLEQVRREAIARFRAVAQASHDGNVRSRDGRRKLIKANPDLDTVALPEPFHTMFARKTLPVADALKELVQYLSFRMTDANREALGLAGLVDVQAMEKRIEAARRKRFREKSDIVDFFAPMLEDLRLRNQLTLTGGGDRGGGVPVLPWVPQAPFIANLGFSLLRRRESAFQIKSPTYGVELMVSEGGGLAGEAKASLGMGIDAGVVKVFSPLFTLKGEKASSHSEFVVLRVLRDKDDSGVRKEQLARDDSLALLDTLVHWDAEDRHPVAGCSFDSPLEAILARHPNVQLGHGGKTVTNTAVGAELAFGARAGFGAGHVSIGPAVVPLSVKVAITKETSDERSGYAHRRVLDRSDQRNQRIGGGMSLGMYPLLVKEAVGHAPQDGEPGSKGSWRMAAPATVDIAREFAYNLEKNGATRFSILDRTGGTVDRAYGTPKDLLAEIEANREEVLMRFLDTLPLEAGEEKDTPQRRELAEAMLAQFVRDLHAAGANPAWQYNVKYELQPRISGWVDALLGLAAIARQEGDVEAETRMRETCNRLLSFRSSWAFKNCAIRSKGRESEERGWDMLVRLLARRVVETSVAPAAYPA